MVVLVVGYGNSSVSKDTQDNINKKIKDNMVLHTLPMLEKVKKYKFCLTKDKETEFLECVQTYKLKIKSDAYRNRDKHLIKVTKIIEDIQEDIDCINNPDTQDYRICIK